MSSLSSLFSFHAPRMLCRGGGNGACSGAFAAVAVPGGGAATGPAGAWARALWEQISTAPATPRNEKASRFFVFKSSSASLPKKAEVRKCHSLEPVSGRKDAFASPATIFAILQLFGRAHLH